MTTPLRLDAMLNNGLAAIGRRLRPRPEEQDRTAVAPAAAPEQTGDASVLLEHNNILRLPLGHHRRQYQELRPLTVHERADRLIDPGQDRTEVATPDPEAGPTDDRDVRIALGLPTSPVIEPRNEPRFHEAFRFTLNQELSPGNRRRPGEALKHGADGDVGIDPPAMRELARRHPERSADLHSRLDKAWTNEDGYLDLGAVDEDTRRRRGWRQSELFRSVYADIWNASGAANLEPGLDVLHFDTAVNLGPGVARQLLEASAGDPQRYVGLREQRYHELQAGPDAQTPRGQFGEVPAKQHGWLQQRMPAIRRMLRLQPRSDE